MLLILFIIFRVLAIVALRPGGQVLDFSDFAHFQVFGEVARQGYYPYDTLWPTYPPLFTPFIIAIYEQSVLLPPWEFPVLWFTLMMGGTFLIFETSNFILLYLLAQKITGADTATTDDEARIARQKALRSCWMYAVFFAPLYTLIGWFESYPLFFFLLSLYLLIQKRPYLSALFTGIGFMVKFLPLMLLPVAVQTFSRVQGRISRSANQIGTTSRQFSALGWHLWLRPHRTTTEEDGEKLAISFPFDLPRTLLYLAIFFVTVTLIGLPFYLMNPDLIFGSQQVTSARLPWQTVWALIDGNHRYGTLPLDLRNTSWVPTDAPPSQIPWLWVTAVFGVIYAIFYTRPINWQQPKSVLAFTGFTLSLFLLWSKGYSPQWLNWSMFFIALLLPNIRGVIYASILNLGDILESNIFFIIFPEEIWLLRTTVIIRTCLLLILAIEYLLLIWPQLVTPTIHRIRAWGLTVAVTILIVGAIPAGLQLGNRFFELRQVQSPYSATLARLQNEPTTGALLLNNHRYRDC
ncbi:MAG: hypothetical protein AAF485_23195, partial [Chloroflexota bacterium]